MFCGLGEDRHLSVFEDMRLHAPSAFIAQFTVRLPREPTGAVTSRWFPLWPIVPLGWIVVFLFGQHRLYRPRNSLAYLEKFSSQSTFEKVTSAKWMKRIYSEECVCVWLHKKSDLLMGWGCMLWKVSVVYIFATLCGTLNSCRIDCYWR